MTLILNTHYSIAIFLGEIVETYFLFVSHRSSKTFKENISNQYLVNGYQIILVFQLKLIIVCNNILIYGQNLLFICVEPYYHIMQIRNLAFVKEWLFI